MPTKKAADALAFLERRRGGPLTFGALLRAIRLGEGMTLDAFAARLGVAKQKLSDIEHGRRGVSIERAAAWAKALGYHAERFVALAAQAQLRAAGLSFTVTVARSSEGTRPRRRAPTREAV